MSSGRSRVPKLSRPPGGFYLNVPPRQSNFLPPNRSAPPGPILPEFPPFPKKRVHRSPPPPGRLHPGSRLCSLGPLCRIPGGGGWGLVPPTTDHPAAPPLLTLGFSGNFFRFFFFCSSLLRFFSTPWSSAAGAGAAAAASSRLRGGLLRFLRAPAQAAAQP